MPLPHDQVLFSGELQKAGYYTAVAGKYYIPEPHNPGDVIVPPYTNVRDN